MKKILCTLALLAVVATSFAQTVEKTEYTAYIGETTVNHQGSYTPDFRFDATNRKVRNVILLIGDGMGLAAVNAGMYANGGELTLTNLHTFGFVRTQSDDNFTTDSAASGTAYATGQKTTNGFVGMDPDKNAIPNIPEMLSPLGTVQLRQLSSPIRIPATKPMKSGPTFPRPALTSFPQAPPKSLQNAPKRPAMPSKSATIW